MFIVFLLENRFLSKFNRKSLSTMEHRHSLSNPMQSNRIVMIETCIYSYLMINRVKCIDQLATRTKEKFGHIFFSFCFHQGFDEGYSKIIESFVERYQQNKDKIKEKTSNDSRRFFLSSSFSHVWNSIWTGISFQISSLDIHWIDDRTIQRSRLVIVKTNIDLGNDREIQWIYF